MALIAGAGNPTQGSNPAGTGTSLNYVRDGTGLTHCYAYSGAISVTDTNEHKLLSFTTGNEHSLVEFIFWRRSWEDDDIAYYVEMDEQQVLAWIGRVAEPQGTNQQVMLIPPFTLVEAYVDKQQNTADSLVGINITGRTYA